MECMASVIEEQSSTHVLRQGSCYLHWLRRSSFRVSAEVIYNFWPPRELLSLDGTWANNLLLYGVLDFIIS